MQTAKWVAIGLCIGFVLGVYVLLNRTVGQFNPNPTTTSVSMETGSCESLSGCSRFTIDSANLTVIVADGVESQFLNMKLTAAGEVPMAKIQVFVDNVSVGVVNGPFAAERPALASLAIPTTITVTQGNTYVILVEGTFVGPAGQTTSNYTQEAVVVAR